MLENIQEQLERLTLAGLELNDAQKQLYLESPDDLGEVAKGTELPSGYKRCGACSHAKKFYLFNKNSGSKTNTSGNCKECQKKSAAKSYSKTKQRRNYKKYYQEHKEIKQYHARKYYEENKDKIRERHKAYLQTAKGKRVMRRAHAKRRKALAENKGIPYTREMVIERDSAFINLEYPICYLCNEPITDTSGDSLHLDHVVPIVEGGLDCFSNVGCTHKGCNLRKEKDARNLTVEQVESIIERTEAYIDAHPEYFED